MSETMGFDSDKTMIGGAPGGDTTQMVSAPRFEATQYAANIDCPVCHTPNPPSETYCMDCGFMMSNAPVELADIPKPQDFGRLTSPNGVLMFPLGAGENSVGREGTDVLLANNTVSRKHAKVIVENGSVFVEDSGSTNGTYVDGVKAQPAVRVEIKDDSELTFGSVVLRYSAPEVIEEDAVQDVAADVVESPQETPEVVLDDAGDTELSDDAVSEPADVTVEAVEEPDNLPMAQLVAKQGGAQLAVLEGLNTIGRRDGANTIVISDPYCSGRHADLSVEHGVFTLTDVGSTNGTLVNGVKLEPNVPKQIVAGDEITIGNPVFVLEVSNE